LSNVEKLNKPIFSSSSVRYPPMDAAPYCRSVTDLLKIAM